MTTISDADRKRLVAILGMLGSTHTGERAAAALQADAFRRKHGMTWEGLIGEVIVETPPIFIERPMPLVRSIITVVAEPFPMVVLTFFALAGIFAAISLLLGNL